MSTFALTIAIRANSEDEANRAADAIAAVMNAHLTGVDWSSDFELAAYDQDEADK